MARAASLKNCDMGVKKTSFLFGADAQGSGEGDHGGYGFVGRVISGTDFRDILEYPEAHGYTVGWLGDFAGSRCPDNLQATVPISVLPDRLFNPSLWQVLGHGRWKFNDHITIGESRAFLKLLKRLSMFEYFHRSFVVPVQDNLPKACSMTKVGHHHMACLES